MQLEIVQPSVRKKTISLGFRRLSGCLIGGRKESFILIASLTFAWIFLTQVSAQAQTNIDVDVKYDESGDQTNKSLAFSATISNNDVSDLTGATLKIYVVTSMKGGTPPKGGVGTEESLYDPAHMSTFKVAQTFSKANLTIPFGQSLNVPLDTVTLHAVEAKGAKKKKVSVLPSLEGYVTQVLKDGKTIYLKASVENLHLMAAFYKASGTKPEEIAALLPST